jgi:pyruvate,orthophosphate dikinase
VNVVTMVFGNMGEDSGTGVAFTRDPNTGERQLYGEFLTNAQGEDVVAGIRTPLKISEMQRLMPEVYNQFEEIAQRLERHYRDMQDLEFTIERGTLYMLQTRSGKRTAPAAVKIAVDMANEGLITREEALQRVDPNQIVQLLLPRFDEAAKEGARDRFLAKGLNASPGAATGRAIFDPDRAVTAKDAGDPVILVRVETSPDDVHGMLAARGVLTARGGATSHAAVVARSMGLPCVAGAEALKIDYAKRQMRAGSVTVAEGDMISIDGTTGEIYAGELPTIEARFEDEHDLATLLGWADAVRRLQVWANADYPRDAERARSFGAQGIGLCRTEHMFFEEERLPTVRRMILNATRATEAKHRRDAGAELTPEDRAAIETFDAALAELEVLQTDDFAGLFRAMDGLPVVIRLIDPPLHEFLPSHEELIAKVTRLRTILELGNGTADAVADRLTPAIEKGLTRIFGEKDAARAMRLIGREGRAVVVDSPGAVPDAESELAEAEELLAAVEAMREQNPMLGMRGIRLGLLIPDIVRMQTRAILAGAARVAAEGRKPLPEIMIPLVGHVNELAETRTLLEAEVTKIVEASGQLQVRDDDRGAARSVDRRRDRRARRVLQLRHERPHPDDVRLQPRRCRGKVPAAVRGPQDPAGEPVPGPGPGGRRPAGPRRDRGRPKHPQEPEGRYLRRARRRSVEHRLLPRGGPGLRELFAVPCPGGSPGRRAGGPDLHRDPRQIASRQSARAPRGACGAGSAPVSPR